MDFKTLPARDVLFMLKEMNVIVNASNTNILVNIKNLEKNNLQLIYYNKSIYIVSINVILSNSFIPVKISNKSFIKLPLSALNSIYNLPQSYSH